MTLTEKVAYLKGLVEGIGVDETTNQGKIMKAVLDVLDDNDFIFLFHCDLALVIGA